MAGGTMSSNPASSSGESRANLKRIYNSPAAVAMVTGTVTSHAITMRQTMLLLRPPPVCCGPRPSGWRSRR
ncbi:MAG TPA: hypothetical protein VGG62_05450, partial [Terracidiphilus sp.]